MGSTMTLRKPLWDPFHVVLRTERMTLKSEVLLAQLLRRVSL